MLTLGTMFLAAGAAGVVSTLWSIDDFATALLMSRFYELLREDTFSDPGEALRGAQLWLRSVTWAEEEAYLVSRSILRAQRSSITRSRLPGSSDEDEQPYADVTLWGAFVFSGA